jgi:hypothetical protein
MTRAVRAPAVRGPALTGLVAMAGGSPIRPATVRLRPRAGPATPIHPACPAGRSPAAR